MGRVLIAGTGSGCGKTTITCGLLYALKQKRIQVASLKCGPDYIDPLYHRTVLGVPTGNLDSYFCDGRTLVSQLVKKEQSLHKDNGIVIVEGVMGYYDGIGITTQASTSEVARLTSTPVILCINASGMGRSLLSIVDGFLMGDKNIKGIILNNISAGLYQQLKPEIADRGVVPVGYLPKIAGELFSSRHLGLVTPDEIGDIQDRIENVAQIMEDTIDWQAFFELVYCDKRPEHRGNVSENAGDAVGCDAIGNPGVTVPDGTRIAIARDEAFCFYYDENIQELINAGVQIVFFSPLRDKVLPANIQGLILWGGYPELYADKLSANTSMIASVREHIETGIPYIAECGGFLYLQKKLCDYSMVGIFEGEAAKENRLRNFGYITLSSPDGRGPFGTKGHLKAHEFHYCHINDEGSMMRADKASGRGSWSTAYYGDNMYAGFPHIYFPGNQEFVHKFLAKTVEHRHE